VRRRAPRPLSAALRGVVRETEPATLLARVQGAWPEVAGDAVAAAARPVAEREGVVTVACESSLWAHELELLGPDLVARLVDRLGASGSGSVVRLRFVVGSEPSESR
jgi:predicted nucleic acid-binding Zn ribbon protein